MHQWNAANPVNAFLAALQKESGPGTQSYTGSTVLGFIQRKRS
jgi:hypothetical protein